ncbi:hypothetical protein BJX99DRAFT_247496 [Aspergillus californicus]
MAPFNPISRIRRSPSKFMLNHNYHQKGYQKLATLMTSDKGLSIFRSFKSLNTMNLLYLQAQIVIKEKELGEIMQEDRNSGVFPRRDFATSVMYLSGGKVAPVIGGGNAPWEQWAKWEEIRGLLEKYNTALEQQAQLLRLKPPHGRDLETFRSWLSRNAFCSIAVEFRQWFGEQGENEKDLITLSGRYENVDLLTRWVFRVAIPFYHEIAGDKMAGDLENGTVYYDDESIIRVTRLICTITSAVIPVSSMLVLFFVDNMVLRLIIIFFYNIGFSIILGFLAKARRAEVFAASTAFAAVQAAFITNFPRG